MVSLNMEIFFKEIISLVLFIVCLIDGVFDGCCSGTLQFDFYGRPLVDISDSHQLINEEIGRFWNVKLVV